MGYVIHQFFTNALSGNLERVLICEELAVVNPGLKSRRVQQIILKKVEPTVKQNALRQNIQKLYI